MERAEEPVFLVREGGLRLCRRGFNRRVSWFLPIFHRRVFLVCVDAVSTAEFLGWCRRGGFNVKIINSDRTPTLK